MDIVRYRCAGLDISKRDVKICVRVQLPTRAKASSTVTTWGAVTSQILALREHLIAQKVTLVVMEATSSYWKLFYYLLEEGPFEIMLVNPRHVKNLLGRKTDVSDAGWPAQPLSPQSSESIIRSARTDSKAARPDPHAQRRRARTRSRDPAPREATRRRRDQTLVSRDRSARGAGSRHARRTGRK